LGTPTQVKSIGISRPERVLLQERSALISLKFFHRLLGHQRARKRLFREHKIKCTAARDRNQRGHKSSLAHSFASSRRRSREGERQEEEGKSRRRSREGKMQEDEGGKSRRRSKEGKRQEEEGKSRRRSREGKRQEEEGGKSRRRSREGKRQEEEGKNRKRGRLTCRAQCPAISVEMMLGRYLAINTEQPMPFRLPMKGQVYNKTLSILIFIKINKR
jgi:hypothetical protein